jgi:hypothetical protein
VHGKRSQQVSGLDAPQCVWTDVDLAQPDE